MEQLWTGVGSSPLGSGPPPPPLHHTETLNLLCVLIVLVEHFLCFNQPFGHLNPNEFTVLRIKTTFYFL